MIVRWWCAVLLHVVQILNLHLNNQNMLSPEEDLKVDRNVESNF